MVKATGAWSRVDRERFLTESTIPLRLACRKPTGTLWVLSLWYRYDAGRFYCATERSAAVVGFLREHPAVAFEVSTNEPPYQGVRGSGVTTIEPDPDKVLLRSLVDRYLGDTESSLARRLLADDRSEVTIEIEPDRLYSWDFSNRMRPVETGP